jgi:hypothetical protein
MLLRHMPINHQPMACMACMAFSLHHHIRRQRSMCNQTVLCSSTALRTRSIHLGRTTCIKVTGTYTQRSRLRRTQRQLLNIHTLYQGWRNKDNRLQRKVCNKARRRHMACKALCKHRRALQAV